MNGFDDLLDDQLAHVSDIQDGDKKYSDKVARLANLTIDYIIFLFIVFAVLSVTSDELHDPRKIFAVLFLGRTLYYIFFEYLFGKTPGKMASNTTVLTEDYKRPSFERVVGRNFARLIPYSLFTFLTKRPYGMHDAVSKTIVVNDKWMKANDLRFSELPLK